MAISHSSARSDEGTDRANHGSHDGEKQDTRASAEICETGADAPALVRPEATTLMESLLYRDTISEVWCCGYVETGGLAGRVAHVIAPMSARTHLSKHQYEIWLHSGSRCGSS